MLVMVDAVSYPSRLPVMINLAQVMVMEWDEVDSFTQITFGSGMWLRVLQSPETLIDAFHRLAGALNSAREGGAS